MRLLTSPSLMPRWLAMLLLGRSRSISRSSWSSAPLRLLRNCSAVKRCTQAGRVTALSLTHFGSVAGTSLSVKCASYLSGRAHPAEEGGHVIYGRPLDLRRPGGHGRVLDHDWPVLVEIGVAQRRFDAHVGCDPRHQEGADAAAAKQGVERRPGKAAVARLRDHRVRKGRLQRVDDLEIPGADRQQLAAQLGTLAHQAQGDLLARVWRALTAGCGLIRRVAHR